MTRQIGDIFTTNIGKRHKEVKKTYYCVQLPKGCLKFSKLEVAKQWSEQLKKSYGIKEV